MSMLLRVCVVLTGLAGESLAGGVAGRLELPAPPERPPVTQRGFLDRAENPLAEVRKVNVGPHLAVVLEGEARPQAPGQVPWELGGGSFGRPLLVVPVGAEILITNTSGAPRTVAALEDPKLIPAGAINPQGSRSFRVTEAKAYTITDKDVPHLRGKLLVVATPYFALVEVGARLDQGTFQIADVAEGSYKLRVFYRDGWLDHPDAQVTVAAKRNADVAVKIPAGFPLRK